MLEGGGITEPEKRERLIEETFCRLELLQGLIERAFMFVGAITEPVLDKSILGAFMLCVDQVDYSNPGIPSSPARVWINL